MSEFALLVNGYGFMDAALVRHERTGRPDQTGDVLQRDPVLSIRTVPTSLCVPECETEQAIPNGR